jgi:hypothetical protein
VEASKQKLAADLRRNGDEAFSRLKGIPESKFLEGRYENGWNAREILAHLASIEWTYPRLIELAATPLPEPSVTGGQRDGTAQGGMDGYNARQVDKRANVPIAELIEEFVANRAKTIAAVEAADEALFDILVRSAGGRTGTLRQVLYEVAVDHVDGHTRDVAG